MLAEIRDEAVTGQLSIDPRVAIECRDAVLKWLDVIGVMQADAAMAGKVEGFPPDLDSAQALAEKFMKKAIGDEGLSIRLSQFSEAAQQLAEVFEYSIKKFRDVDEAAEAYLKGLGL